MYLDQVVIFPVTTTRLAMGAVRDGLAEIYETGTQNGLIEQMHTRKELYELIRYEEYNNYDQSVFNFKVR